MTTLTLSQQTLNQLKRHALIVLLICYIPHVSTEPVWLFIYLIAVIFYRLMADYVAYPPLPKWVRLMVVVGGILILSANVLSSGFFVRFLLFFIITKCIELNTIRDLKALTLANFFVIFSALIVTQELWMIIYLFLAVFANLSLMIKLSAPQISLSQMGSKSGWQLLIVIPLSVFLFYIFPRLEPLWRIQSFQKTSTSLSETMRPGSIAALFDDDSTVMQITFNQTPILKGYWRTMILSIYNGVSWVPSSYSDSSFMPLGILKGYEKPDYDILIEPNQSKWLFYQGMPIAADVFLIYSADHGLMRGTREPVSQAFSYSLKVQAPLYHELSKVEYENETEIPRYGNERLRAWAKDQFIKSQNDPKAFIEFLHQYIHDQSFWYTLIPPALHTDTNQIDEFWFDTKKGYCEHYASAITYILRAAGIPARVVLGYYGGRFNPITRTITIQQNMAHAWLEYWTAGTGWQQLDPTSFIAEERIDKTIADRSLSFFNQDGDLSVSAMPWRLRISMITDSIRFYSERWFLFYNQNTQQELLQFAGFRGWKTDDLLQASVICIPVFFFLIGFYYRWRETRQRDPLWYEYHLLQSVLRQLGIATPPGATILNLCQAIMDKYPDASITILSFLESYEQTRLMQVTINSKKSKNEAITLIRRLRMDLKHLKVQP